MQAGTHAARPTLGLLTTLLIATTAIPAAFAAGPNPGPPLTITRATGAITADGDLGDAGWQNLTPVTTWFETRIGDNLSGFTLPHWIMALAATGRVEMLTQTYPLEAANEAMDDLDAGRLRGRGIRVPSTSG